MGRSEVRSRNPILRLRKRYYRWRYRNNPRYRSFRGVDSQVLNATIAYNQFGAYCVPWELRDRPAARRIFAGGIYEEATIRRVAELGATGDIVHAGTFFGDFLPPLVTLTGGQSRVWAFEPNPESHRCAELTRQLNALDQVSLTHAGLGAESGELHVQVSDSSGKSLGGRSHLVETAAAGTCPVPVLALDEVIPADSAIAVIQLDVEGHEVAALNGAMELIRRCRPAIILETLPDEAWLDAHLFPLGYSLAGRIDRNYELSA